MADQDRIDEAKKAYQELENTGMLPEHQAEQVPPSEVPEQKPAQSPELLSDKELFGDAPSETPWIPDAKESATPAQSPFDAPIPIPPPAEPTPQAKQGRGPRKTPGKQSTKEAKRPQGVKGLNLDDGVKDGFKDPEPSELRGLDDLRGAAFQYHNKLMELITGIRNVLIEGVGDIDNIQAYFNRLR